MGRKPLELDPNQPVKPFVRRRFTQEWKDYLGLPDHGLTAPEEITALDRSQNGIETMWEAAHSGVPREEGDPEDED